MPRGDGTRPGDAAERVLAQILCPGEMGLGPGARAEPAGLAGPLEARRHPVDGQLDEAEQPLALGIFDRERPQATEQS